MIAALLPSLRRSPAGLVRLYRWHPAEWREAMDRAGLTGTLRTAMEYTRCAYCGVPVHVERGAVLPKCEPCTRYWDDDRFADL